MKKTEIKIGSVYCNRGAGKIKRTVLGIGDEYTPGWDPFNKPGVLYAQDGVEYKLSLKSFAHWAGEEVVPSWARTKP